MQRLRGIPRYFRFPWRTARQIHREVDEELGYHLDLRTEELVRGGLTTDAARREALRQFGDLEGTRRSLKAQGRHGETRRRTVMTFGDSWRDMKYAWRSLTRSPGFTTVAVLVLALGIGANSAMFSLLNMLMMRPMMIENPEELVGVYSKSTEKPDTYRAFSYPNYVDIRDRNPVFTELAAHTITVVGVAEGDVTQRAMAGIVSANYFETFGVPLGRGRAFTLEEEQPSGESPAVIVSHDFWARRGKDPGLLGSTLWINGHPVDVIGIAADGFTGSTAVFSPDLWLPLGLYERVAMAMGGPTTDGAPAPLNDRQNHDLMVFGRLRPGRSAAAAETELQSLAARLEAEYPAINENQTFVLAPLPRLSISTSPSRENFLAAPAVLLMGMTGVVLFIACLNLANMFLARGASRRTEMAIRASLGGGRQRLLRQLLSEGLVLAFLGGAAGLVLAYWGAKLLFSSIGGLLPFGITLVFDVSPDLRVLSATVALCVLATLFFGLGPAWRLTGGDLLASLKQSTAGNASTLGGGRSRKLWAPRNLLIVAQIALSLVLLTAGGLFTRGAFNAARATPGFGLDGSLLVELDPSLSGHGMLRSKEIYRDVLERLRSLPGVENASLASIVPFGSITNTRKVELPGASDDEDAVSAHFYVVGDDYFESLRLPMLRGRDFTATEATGDDGARVAIIDEPLAEQLFGNEDALGRHLRIAATASGAEPIPLEIIGVVPGTRHQFWDQEPSPHLYVPFGQQYMPNMHVHVRIADGMSGDEAAILATVRKEIRAIDPALPVLGLKTMRDHRDESVFLWLVRTGAKVFSVLGALALFLALVGVYGVKAFVMARRTREIGLRMALGATRGEVLRQMVREGLVLTATGLGLGLVLSAATARLLSSMLYEVDAADPAVFVGAALVLAAAATLASYLPARRATRISPLAALRYE